LEFFEQKSKNLWQHFPFPLHFAKNGGNSPPKKKEITALNLCQPVQGTWPVLWAGSRSGFFRYQLPEVQKDGPLQDAEPDPDRTGSTMVFGPVSRYHNRNSLNIARSRMARFHVPRSEVQKIARAKLAQFWVRFLITPTLWQEVEPGLESGCYPL
jgi:hypothetical protein